jgi:selenium metabolism protein YedF
MGKLHKRMLDIQFFLVYFTNNKEEQMRKTTVFIDSDCLGRGDDDLGRALMLAAIKNMPESGMNPSTIILMNNGVKLVAGGSPALKDLLKLSENGCDIISCGTCLDWFEIQGSFAVGRRGTMIEALRLMDNAEHLIKL